MSHIYNIRMAFELRNSVTHQTRALLGRIFKYQDQLGICDASGALWPIRTAEKCDLQHGDHVHCDYVFKKNDHESSTSDDLFFSIEKITDHHPSKGPWEVPGVPDPTNALAQTHHSSNSKTQFFHTGTQKRFQKIRKKNEMIHRVRNYFSHRCFLEIETPTLVPSGGVESYLHPFQTNYTDHRGKKTPLQMPTSPEFSLKKILCEGPEKIFNIAPAFRNCGELSAHHEPEFLMLEWYRRNGTLAEILEDTRKLILDLSKRFHSSIDVPQHWRTFKVPRLFEDILHCDLNALQNTQDFYNATKHHSPSLRETDTWNDIFCKLFMEKIEPHLAKEIACFVTDYPMQMAALAEKNPKYPNFAKRAEAFLCGVEICNAYQELVDAEELLTRKEQALKERPEILVPDPVFESCMKFGLPKSAGNALGLERVIAILNGNKTVAESKTIPFASQFLPGKIHLE